MDLNFEKLFKITTTSLRIILLHPDLKRNKLWLLKNLLWQCYMISIFSLAVYNICYDIKTENFSRTCRDGTVIMVFSMITVQFLVLISNKESLLRLIKHMENDYKTFSSLIPEEQMVIKNYADKGLYVCKQWFLLAIIAVFAFLLKSVLLSIYNYYYLGIFQLVQFYEFEYPDAVSTYMDSISGFFFTYVYIVAYSTYAATMYTAYCPLGPIFMLHACGQLEIVKIRLDNLFVELDDKVIKEKLTFIIERLQYTYKFVNIINNIFKIPYELTLKGSTIVIPITFYEVIEAAKRREVSVDFITFIFGSILISSSPCYFSDLLKEKGEDVRQAIYASGWEVHYNRRTRNTIHILLMNALRPIALRTVFRTLCLETLADLFQQSYTLFNLMNATWEQ